MVSLRYRSSPLGTTLWEWFQYGNFRNATNAAGFTLTAYLGLQLPPDPQIVMLAFCLAFIMYSFDRISHHDSPDDRVSRRRRSQWIAAHLSQLKICFGIAVVGCLVLMGLHPMTLLIVFPCAGFTLSYSQPVLPGGRAPKSLPGIKAFYAAFFWIMLVVGIPVVVTQRSLDQVVIEIAVLLFCILFALINHRDIQDIEGDRMVGTLTLPVLFGESFAGGASLVSLGISLILSIWLADLGYSIMAAYFLIGMVLFPHRMRDWYFTSAGIALCLLINHWP